MMSINIVRSGVDISKYFIDKGNNYLTDKSALKRLPPGMVNVQWYLDRLSEQIINRKKFIKLLMISKSVWCIMVELNTAAPDITFSGPKFFSIMKLTTTYRRCNGSIVLTNQYSTNPFNYFLMLYMK